MAEFVREEQIFLSQILNGLLDGVYYLLIALGLSLIFSLGGIVNLAHGAFYAIGAYLAVSIGQALGFGGAALLSPLAVGLLGVGLVWAAGHWDWVALQAQPWARAGLLAGVLAASGVVYFATLGVIGVDLRALLRR